MQAKAIVRVFCLDGPCPGVNYVDADTGRILFREVASGERRFYRINQQAYNAGRRPDAYFDRVEAAPAAGRRWVAVHPVARKARFGDRWATGPQHADSGNHLLAAASSLSSPHAVGSWVGGRP